jgi:hypothetical protein
VRAGAAGGAICQSNIVGSAGFATSGAAGTGVPPAKGGGACVKGIGGAAWGEKGAGAAGGRGAGTTCGGTKPASRSGVWLAADGAAGGGGGLPKSAIGSTAKPPAGGVTPGPPAPADGGKPAMKLARGSLFDAGWRSPNTSSIDEGAAAGSRSSKGLPLPPLRGGAASGSGRGGGDAKGSKSSGRRAGAGGAWLLPSACEPRGMPAGAGIRSAKVSPGLRPGEGFAKAGGGDGGRAGAGAGAPPIRSAKGLLLDSGVAMSDMPPMAGAGAGRCAGPGVGAGSRGQALLRSAGSVAAMAARPRVMSAPRGSSSLSTTTCSR